MERFLIDGVVNQVSIYEFTAEEFEEGINERINQLLVIPDDIERFMRSSKKFISPLDGDDWCSSIMDTYRLSLSSL